MPSIRCVIFLLASALLVACGRHSTPAATSPATAPATLAAAPIPAGPRIVSTVPAATLNLVLLHDADALVGVSPYDTLFLPDDKQNLPVIGDYEHMNYERLIALHPTTVIVQTSPTHISARLRELAAAQHFDILNIKLDTLDDLWSTIGQLGRAAGKPEAATTAILEAQGDLKEIAGAMTNQSRPKVVYVISRNPLMIVGSDNFMDQMLTLAGADNVGAKIGRSFAAISNETMVKLAPDVLLISDPGAPEQIVDDPRLVQWQRFNIPAVRTGRVFLVTDGNALTASLDLPRNIRALAALVHRGEPAKAGPAAAPVAGTLPGSKP